MALRRGRDLLHRWERNPIITPRDVPYRCNTVFNGTPVKLDGEYLMVVRVEGQQGYSYFALARSRDGLHFEVEDEPCMMPAAAMPSRLGSATTTRSGTTIAPRSTIACRAART